MVDNLMSTRFNVSKDNDYYRAQSNFTGRLVDFAKRFGAHVHLVVHPRKTEAGRRLEADDVGGSGDVTNRADNVFSVQRLDANTAAENGYDTVLSVLKNRSFGETPSIGLKYDSKSRRLYDRSGRGFGKDYGWSKAPQHIAEIEDCGDMPREWRNK